MLGKVKVLAVVMISLLSLIGVGAALTLQPASVRAASASCTPTIGSAIEWWMWTPPANGAPGEVTFGGSAGSAAIGPYPASVSEVDHTWGQIDDVAPILWYAKNVPGSAAQLVEIFSGCQQWSSQMVASMNAQKFAPSQVGGVNPPGITSAGGSTGTAGTGSDKIVTITVNASPVNYYVGGTLVTPASGMFDNQGKVVVSDSLVFDKTTYVPIRLAAQLLGQPVAWNSAQHGVDITASPAASSPSVSSTRLHQPPKPTTRTITVDETPIRFYVSGVDQTPAGGKFDNQGVVVPDGFIFDQTTYIPIRLAADLLHVAIRWDSSRYAVDIGAPPTSATVGQTIAPVAVGTTTSAPPLPPVLAAPPPGSAAKAAHIIAQDKVQGAGSNTKAGTHPGKTSLARMLLVAVIVGTVIAGGLLLFRSRRRAALYRIR